MAFAFANKAFSRPEEQVQGKILVCTLILSNSYLDLDISDHETVQIVTLDEKLTLSTVEGDPWSFKEFKTKSTQRLADFGSGEIARQLSTQHNICLSQGQLTVNGKISFFHNQN